MVKDNIVSTFYKFIELENLEEWKLKLLKFCNENKMKGTILIANEGLNSTVTAPRIVMDQFYLFIKSFKEFSDLEFKESIVTYIPFKRMKVRLKKEIVTFKVPNLDMKRCGEYLNSDQWDEKLKDPEAKVIDTRNFYERKFGTFERSIDPLTHNFSELPDWIEKNLGEDDKEKPILMFCTGGIRCEKSTAYLVQKGFKQVYHLKGGVLKYLAETSNKHNLWKGECFVFDDRVAVDEKLVAIEEMNG